MPSSSSYEKAVGLCCTFCSRFSLLIYRTSLEFLGLVSLESIEHGNVAVLQNEQLCYVGNIPWSEILHSSNQSRIVRQNMASDYCGR